MCTAATAAACAGGFVEVDSNVPSSEDSWLSLGEDAHAQTFVATTNFNLGTVRLYLNSTETTDVVASFAPDRRDFTLFGVGVYRGGSKDDRGLWICVLYGAL